MPAFLKQLLHKCGPYGILAVSGILAYLPVISMTYALKNDIIALEYPINYFISQCLHNGVSPFWFNTWAMGFPLESILTWSIYSPAQFLFNALFHFSLYTLHVEFVFFIVLAGCSMYSMLQNHFSGNRSLALLLSCCYMLSGFMVGSSQWLLYITAASFLPLLLSRFLWLLKTPHWRNAFLFSAVLYLHITSVYVAFTIIACYILLFMTGFFFWQKFAVQSRKNVKRITAFLLVSILIVLVLSFPLLYSSLELIGHINRGKPMEAGTAFFNSNFLHPKGLQSLVLPLSMAKITVLNSEGSMMNSYLGLLPLLLLPCCLLKSWKEKNKLSFLLLAISLLFLTIAFGDITPLRAGLNVLPGFAYFRNPGLFRLYFIFFLLLFIYQAADRHADFFSLRNSDRKPLIQTAIVLLVLLTTIAVLHRPSLTQAANGSVKSAIQTLTYNDTIFINVLLQVGILVLLLIALYKRRTRLFSFLVIGELVLNTLICTPFFTVSSYSVKEVTNLFGTVQGFPVQKTLPAAVPTTYSQGSAIWHNVNIYSKEVSLQRSYWGPLVLNNFTLPDEATLQSNQTLVSSDNEATTILVKQQQPDHIVATVSSPGSATITLLQNFYPGWKAYFNGNEIAINPDGRPGMNATIPSSGTIEFIYKKQWLLYAAIGINVLLILTFLLHLYSKIKSLRRT